MKAKTSFFLNSQAAYFFAVLLIVHLMFGVFLVLASKVTNKKGLSYLYFSLFFKALLSLGPALLMFDADISWNAYLTGNLKVSLFPLSYLYLKKLAEKNKNLKKGDLWHFIPVLFSIILTLIVVPGNSEAIVAQSNETLKSSMQMIWSDNMPHNILATTSRIITFGQALLYSFLVFRLFKRYLAIIKSNDSLITHTNTIWIKWVILMFLFQAFFEGFGLVGIYNYTFLLLIGFAYQLIFAFFFVIHALLQKDLSQLFNSDPKKEFDSAIIDENGNGILKQFIELELFLKPDITLGEAADKLNIPKSKLSQIIKAEGYLNFYSFINKYRIDKSIELLVQIPDNQVIESVVQQSGFNSRATFYRVFKQITGKTPSEYLN